MDWLPALYIWLVVAVSGPVVAFLAGYLVDERKAGFLGVGAAAVFALMSVTDDALKGDWWTALAAILGVGTAWWHLFGRDARRPT
jgi:hypothetical protein